MRTRLGLAIVAISVMAVAAACTQPSGGGGGPAVGWGVDPAVTGSGISSDALNSHKAYLPSGTARNRLAVVLHGTGGSPGAHLELMATLRSAGFHVIGLRYPAAVGTVEACPDSGALTDPDCHRTFRSEVVYGEGVTDPDGNAYDHPLVDITPANSVMNRLLRLVAYLPILSPTGNWEQFQQSTNGVCDVIDPTYGVCDLRWDQVVVLGFSQGGGVGLYLAKHHALDAVGLLSAPFDGYPDGAGGWVAAPWIAEGGLDVPAARIGALSHTSDNRFQLFRAVQNTIGIAGPEVPVNSSSPPYGGSRRLVTSVASTCPLDSVPSHLSTAVDACTPDGAYSAAWVHLATP